MKILEGATEHSIWRITGNYRNGGTFHDCLATVIPQYTHGTDETALVMLPPLNGTGVDRVITPDQVTRAELVVEDPWAGGRLFTAAKIIQIANETSDSQGNLYRIDFINRINHEATITEETTNG
ncbi:hypothetical protein [Microbacterium telephonicum]|uniref:Uncharacterized protein n=1 Tax=Microbacterium telephonicum TaxID=1714841 RepID=A0A498BXK8_9MICO|nr:hypothetical protein [Microbacterium telephonicum]RLK47637.1 hypothetical protein C7474_2232 [Microbacterium telephonicum]